MSKFLIGAYGTKLDTKTLTRLSKYVDRNPSLAQPFTNVKVKLNPTQQVYSFRQTSLMDLVLFGAYIKYARRPGWEGGHSNAFRLVQGGRGGRSLACAHAQKD